MSFLRFLSFWDFEFLSFLIFEFLRFWVFEILRFWVLEFLRFWVFEILWFWVIEFTQIKIFMMMVIATLSLIVTLMTMKRMPCSPKRSELIEKWCECQRCINNYKNTKVRSAKRQNRWRSSQKWLSHYCLLQVRNQYVLHIM